MAPPMHDPVLASWPVRWIHLTAQPWRGKRLASFENRVLGRFLPVEDTRPPEGRPSDLHLNRNQVDQFWMEDRCISSVQDIA